MQDRFFFEMSGMFLLMLGGFFLNAGQNCSIFDSFSKKSDRVFTCRVDSDGAFRETFPA